MQRFLDELEITEEQLTGKEYKINVIRVIRDLIVGIIKIQENDFNFDYNCNSKVLSVDGDEEKELQWLKDIIKCYSFGEDGRKELAKKESYHDILINDKDEYVRRAIAETTINEKYLEILTKDESWHVRRAVAETTNNEKFLEILINDEDLEVRIAVVRRGLYHDILINDECFDVRETIAKITNNEKYLEKLVKDENWYVRAAVADRGYGLDTLYKSTGEGGGCIKRACKDFMKANGIKDIREYKKDKEKWYEFARTNIIKD